MSSLVDALRDKYVHTGEDGAEDELVGAAMIGSKQALDRLSRVFLPRAGIASAGPDGELARLCGGIKELDLEGNPLPDWSAVVAIAQQLPQLAWLGLNHVQLAPLEAPPADLRTALGGLQTLCLNSTGVAWEQLVGVAAALPELRELHFNGNSLATTRAADGSPLPLPKLRTLFLENNALDGWGAVEPLSDLPALETLNLNANGIGELPAKITGFGSLRQLMLRGNPISSWASVDALDGMAALRELRLVDVPLTADSSAALARRVIIARVGGLAVLNGSEVRPRERDDAERFYLRQISDSFPQGGLPADAVPASGGDAVKLPDTEPWRAFEAEHPRLRPLLLKHGEQRAAAAAGGAAGGVLAAELIEITMRCTAPEMVALPPAARKLPGGLPIKTLKLIASQLYKVEPAKQRLLYSPPGQEADIPEQLDDDLKRLCDFAVVTGGTIVVQEIDD